LSRFNNESDTIFVTTLGGGGPNSYATTYENETAGLSTKLDVEQPLPDDRFLTLGAAYDYSDESFENSLTALAGATPPSYVTALYGTSQTLAGYVTYQFDLGD
jgi:hypothetical protein